MNSFALVALLAVAAAARTLPPHLHGSAAASEAELAALARAGLVELDAADSLSSYRAAHGIPSITIRKAHPSASVASLVAEDAIARHAIAEEAAPITVYGKSASPSALSRGYFPASAAALAEDDEVVLFTKKFPSSPAYAKYGLIHSAPAASPGAVLSDSRWASAAAPPAFAKYITKYSSAPVSAVADLDDGASVLVKKIAPASVFARHHSVPLAALGDDEIVYHKSISAAPVVSKVFTKYSPASAAFEDDSEAVVVKKISASPAAPAFAKYITKYSAAPVAADFGEDTVLVKKIATAPAFAKHFTKLSAAPIASAFDDEAVLVKRIAAAPAIKKHITKYAVPAAADLADEAVLVKKITTTPALTKYITEYSTAPAAAVPVAELDSDIATVFTKKITAAPTIAKEYSIKYESVPAVNELDEIKVFDADWVNDEAPLSAKIVPAPYPGAAAALPAHLVSAAEFSKPIPVRASALY